MKKRSLILRILLILLTIPVVIACALIIMRSLNAKQLDDVSPNIWCEESLLKKADVLFIIPFYNNDSIANYPNWCSHILSLNKTLALHGIHHSYQEFLHPISEEEFNASLKAFRECFNQDPSEFKPPQLEISSQNAKFIKSKNLELDGEYNQLIHKVYHCSDTGKLSNAFIDKW